MYGMKKVSFTLATETILSEADIHFLMTELKDYGFKWEDIGYSLHFRHGELKGLQQSNSSYSSTQLLRELLLTWSYWPTDDHQEKPTLEKLCDALSSSLVGLGKLADVVCSKRSQLPSLRQQGLPIQHASDVWAT